MGGRGRAAKRRPYRDTAGLRRFVSGVRWGTGVQINRINGIPFEAKFFMGGENLSASLIDAGRAFLWVVYQYMPPMPGLPAGAAGSGAGMSVTRDSVVRTMAATEAAFWRAERVTLVGSAMPRSIMSVYSSFAAS